MPGGKDPGPSIKNGPRNKPCKFWPGTTLQSSRRYRQIWFEGKHWYLHRLVFFLNHGYLPQVVRHTCDNPACWEPTHLVGGTQKDNMHDMIERGRGNWHHKLTEEDIVEIVHRYQNGEHPDTIASDFNIHKNHVTKVVRRRHPEITRSRQGKGRWEHAEG